MEQVSINDDWAILEHHDGDIWFVHKFCRSRYPHESVIHLFRDEEISTQVKCMGCKEIIPKKILAIARLYTMKI